LGSFRDNPDVASQTPALTIDVRTYPALFRRVKETLLEGKKRIETEKIHTRWETGYYIQQHILQNNGRADYGKQVIIKLAGDLDVSEAVLYRCLQFFEQYPDYKKVARARELTWSHYQELLGVPDDKQRLLLEKAITENGLTRDEVRARKKAQRTSGRAEPEKPAVNDQPSIRTTADGCQLTVDPLVPLKGTLYTYQIVKRKIISGDFSELVVDLGFSNYRDVDARLISNFSDGDVVASVPKDDAYRFSKSDRTAKDLYTYAAFVEKVVDGDTLKVHIDLGFETWTRQSLRLRGIDCPELKTKDGDAAKAFVQSHLKACDRIVVRSIKPDKFDRYLADIFLPAVDGEAEVYLNNLLLEKGFAERWG
jgi:hypothetical protein